MVWAGYLKLSRIAWRTSVMASSDRPAPPISPSARLPPAIPTEVIMRLDELAIASALRCILGPATLILLAGCATLTVVPAECMEGQHLTPNAEAVAHIYAANWGVYLFKYVPLITGSLARPGVPKWPALFSDEVQIDLLAQMVSAESRQRGGNVLTDLRTRDRSYWLGWTLIFWLNEFEVSANSSRLP